MLIKILDEVKGCIENECFIAALALALTIPDICGKAEYPTPPGEREKTRERYIKWYDEHIGKYEKSGSPHSEDMPRMSGELIYNLRNSLLHQGNPGIVTTKIKDDVCRVDKFILTLSDVGDAGLSSVSYDVIRNDDGQIMKDEQGEMKFAVKTKSIEVNIINLCSKLCRTAKGYYRDNKEKFNFFSYELRDYRHKFDGLFTLDDVIDE